MTTLTTSQQVVQVARTLATHQLIVSQAVVQIGYTQAIHTLVCSQLVVEVAYKPAEEAVRVPRHGVVMAQPMIV